MPDLNIRTVFGILIALFWCDRVCPRFIVNLETGGAYAA